MKRFQDFLDSLSTIGGNILVSVIVAALLVGVYLHVIHDGRDAGAVETVKDLVIAFGGSLLTLLKGNSSKQQMVDRNDAALGAPKVDASQAKQVNVAGTLEQKQP